MPESPTYTINEAAALTGRHPNTIRQRIRLGQLEATTHQGKFGEEYRITHAALVRAGVLPGATTADDHSEEVETLDAEFTPFEPGRRPREWEAPPSVITDLFERHEHAMFRLGYLQAETERLKSLEASAESLRQERESEREELRSLRADLVEKERQAPEAESMRTELERARERLRELEALRADITQLKGAAEERERLLAELRERTERRRWRLW